MDSSENDHSRASCRWQNCCICLSEISAEIDRTASERTPPLSYLFLSLSDSLLFQSKTPPEALVETLSILSILIVRFPANLTSLSFDAHPLTTLAPLLSHPRPIVRRRAITTISQYIPLSPPEIVSSLMSTDVLPNLLPNAPLDKQRTTVQLTAALARHSPGHITPVLDQIIPGILKAAQKEDEELRENSLLALEALVLRCPAEVASSIPAIIQAGNQLIKYDPVRYMLVNWQLQDLIFEAELCR